MAYVMQVVQGAYYTYTLVNSESHDHHFSIPSSTDYQFVLMLYITISNFQ